MPKSVRVETNGHQLLEEEFIALRSAARLAYGHIADMGKHSAPSDEEDAQVEHLVGIALSTVAPIYMRTSVGTGAFLLSGPEIEKLLFQPLRRTGKPPPLDNLLIRQRDLSRAIKTLTEARRAFGRRGSA